MREEARAIVHLLSRGSRLPIGGSMPDLASILEFYRALARATMHGALAGEAQNLARSEHDEVVRRFLAPTERLALRFLPGNQQRGRMRKGEQRFRRWERDNPDLVSLLMRKAENQALGAA